MKKMTVIFYVLILALWAGAALAKVDTLWSKLYHNSVNSSNFNACCIDSQNNIYVCGNTNTDYLFLKYNKNGDSLWCNIIGGAWGKGDNAQSCVIDDSNNVIFTGTVGTGTGSYISTHKLSTSNMGTIWSDYYSELTELSHFEPNCVCDEAGNVYIACSADTTFSDPNISLIKYNGQGGVLWEKRYNSPFNMDDRSLGCLYDKNGYIYILGWAQNTTNHDIMLLKYNLDGDTVWTKNILTDAPYSANDCAIDSFGNVYVCGYYNNGGNIDVFLAKYDNNGHNDWLVTYDDTLNSANSASSCAIDKNQKIYLTGYTEVGAKRRMLLLKYLPDGTKLWDMTYSSIYDTLDYASSIAIDDSNNIVVAGGVLNTTNSLNDGIVVKFRETVLPPGLIIPAHETFTNDLSPHFLWHSTDSSAWYKLQVSEDPGFGTLWHDGLGPDTTQQVGLTGGRWYWRVRAYSGPDSSDWSAVRALNVDTTYPYPPVLKGPPDMAWVSGGPALSWNWIPGLAQCRVQVSADTNFITIADSATIADSVHVPSLMDGKYFWRVQAADSAGNWSGWGEVRRFRLDASPPTIVSTWPINGQTLVQPTDTIKIAFSERIVPGSFMYGIDPGVGAVSGSGAGDTMKLWSSGFSLGATYTVTVTAAQDSAGNNLGAGPAPNPFSFTITPDATGPSIVYNNTGASLTPGLPMPIEVLATDPSGMGPVYLYYRRGGEAGFTESAMSLHPGDVYRDTIPGASIGERGISYYFRASDALGSHSALPAGAPAARFHRPVAMDVVTYPASLSGGSYRMFSVPFNPASPPWRPYELTDDLGSYDDTQWRLFRWQSGAYAEFNAVQDIIPGRAYWVINRVGGTFDLANALSVGDSALQIPLASGWNMVGVPFAYPVSAADIMVHDGGGGNYYPILDSNNTVTERRLVEWLGTGYSNQTQMEPWKGYWVKSNYANIYLEIPPVSAMGKVMAAPAQSGWTLALEASCGEYHDRDNRLGITPRGPRNNASEPPAVEGGLSLAFERDGRRLAEDYRTELGSGQSWNFAVGNDREGTVSLQWAEEGLRGDWQYALYDVTAGREAGGQGVYSFCSERGGEVRRFVLLAGTQVYLASESARAGLLPAATLLGQNHPNPFSSRTAVSYQLARPARVSLAVYNLLGQKVRTLAEGEQGAGRYTAGWDGRDQSGRAAGSGVYFLRLEAGGEAFSRRMLLLR